jgi:hypothetical protein
MKTPFNCLFFIETSLWLFPSLTLSAGVVFIEAIIPLDGGVGGILIYESFLHLHPTES